MTDREGRTLRQRIALQRPRAPEDNLGGGPEVFDPAGEVFAEITPASAVARTAFGGVVAATILRCSVRKPLVAASGWRVLWEGRIFRIRMISEGVPPEEFLVLELEQEFR